MQQIFLKKLVLLVSFRGQKMREPRPDWSPLGVNFKILDAHPYLFYISSPLPRDTFCSVSAITDEAPRSAKKKHRRAKSNLESQVCDWNLQYFIKL